MRGWGAVFAAAMLLPPNPTAADLLLPSGFTGQVYVTGEGFDAGRGFPGIPATSTLAFDDAGFLYLARTGRRYTGGEVEDLWPIYRIPPGGARVTPESEARYLHGPPLRNPQIAAIRGGREVLVTTFDHDRKIGVLYRMRDGRAELLAGGTPDPGRPPLLRQPEGAAVDAAGHVYIADRIQGARGSPGLLRTRPRPALPHGDKTPGPDRGRTGAALGRERRRRPGSLAAGSGRDLECQSGGRGDPHGPRAHPRGDQREPRRVSLRRRPAGRRDLRRRPEGKRTEFARFTEGDAPRGLVFAPVTGETRRAGIAGDLFVVTITRGAWPVNEVLRISGPFDGFVRDRRAGAQ